MDDLVDERSRQMQYLGTEGNFIMMEAIELAYDAVSEMSLECLQEALQQLEEGHPGLPAISVCSVVCAQSIWDGDTSVALRCFGGRPL